jgi:hypothetical protein
MHKKCPDCKAELVPAWEIGLGGQNDWYCFDCQLFIHPETLNERKTHETNDAKTVRQR